MFFFALQEYGLDDRRGTVTASALSATCRKVKRSTFELVCFTATDDVDRAWDRVKGREEGQEKDGAQCGETSGLQWEGFVSFYWVGNN